MNYENENQPYTKAQRPRSDEGMAICEKIAEWQNQSYLAIGIGISNQAVAKWFDRKCRDLFTRVRDFVRGVFEDGRADIGLRILRYICSGVGYQPVKIPPTKVQFLTIYRSICQHQIESADVAANFYAIVQDGTITQEEAESMLREIEEERQALENLAYIFEEYRNGAQHNGGRVVIDPREFAQKVLQS